jgi:predicted dehydrogenase
MLRYLRAVQMMKEIIQKNNLTVMATTARYIASYEKINNSNWWDKSIMSVLPTSSFSRPLFLTPLFRCGPIVEQGTHFCDLSRYFGGDVDIPTVQALSVEHYEKPGKLSKIPIDEAKINEENRIPRVTSATWLVKLSPPKASYLMPHFQEI